MRSQKISNEKVKHLINFSLLLMLAVFIVGLEQQLNIQQYQRQLYLAYQNQVDDSEYIREFDYVFYLLRTFTVFTFSLAIIALTFMDNVIYQIIMASLCIAYYYYVILRYLISYQGLSAHDIIKQFWPSFIFIATSSGMIVIFVFIYTQSNRIQQKNLLECNILDQKWKIIIEQMTSAVFLVSQNDTETYTNLEMKKYIQGYQQSNIKNDHQVQVTMEQINANIVQITEVIKEKIHQNHDSKKNIQERVQTFQQSMQNLRESSKSIITISTNEITKKTYSGISKNNQNQTIQLLIHMSLINLNLLQKTNNNKNNEEVILIQLEDVSQIMKLKVFEKNSKFQSTLLQNFSHQLLTPLNGAITPLENSSNCLVALKGLQQTNNSSQLEQEYSQEVIDDVAQCQSCFQTLQNFLLFINDFNLIHANQFVLLMKMVHFEKFINDINVMMHYCASIKDIKYSTEFQQQDFPQFIYSDEIRLKQVILKLVQNAIYVTPVGGEVTLSIKKVQLEATHEELIEISIKDNGIGLRANASRELVENLEQIRTQGNLASATHSMCVIDQMGIILTQHIAVQFGPRDKKEACGLFFESQQQKGTTVKFLVCIPKRAIITISSSSNIMSSPDSDSEQIQYNQPRQNSHQIINLEAMNKMRIIPEIVSKEFAIQHDDEEKSQSQSQSPQSLGNNEGLIDLTEMSDNAQFQKHQKYQSNVTKEDQQKQFNQKQQSFTTLVSQKLLIKSPSTLSEHFSEDAFIQEDVLQKYFHDYDIMKHDDQKKPICINISTIDEIVKNECKECKDILIVDDDAFNLLSLEMLIKKIGMTSQKAFNGQEAVDILRNAFQPEYRHKHPQCRNFRLVIMDYDMPVLNGVQATLQIQKLIKQYHMDDIPIVACTAYNAKKDIQVCLDAGMKDFIRKPITLTTLNDVLIKFHIISRQIL